MFTDSYAVAGSIDYEEFLAATVNLNHLEKEETMYNAFQYFDTDNSGYITEQEMEDALKVLQHPYCSFADMPCMPCWHAVLSLFAWLTCHVMLSCFASRTALISFQ